MSKVLLSFDVEEFDLPREHGMEISLEEGVRVSAAGLVRILDVLNKNNVKATFFCTGNFVRLKPDLMRRIVSDGHEVACHGVDHFDPKETDVKESKKIVEKVAGVKVVGYRQPRMGKIDYKGLKKSGYEYDSSVNPTLMPGRYNNLSVPRQLYEEGGVVEVPTSVATSARVPLFWLALHLFPEKVYYGLVKLALKKSGYFATYFHPWEFADLSGYNVVPKYIKHNSGVKLEKRLYRLIRNLKKNGYVFETYEEYVKAWKGVM